MICIVACFSKISNILSLWGGDYNTIVSTNRRPWADHLELLNVPPCGERQEVLVNLQADDC